MMSPRPQKNLKKFITCTWRYSEREGWVSLFYFCCCFLFCSVFVIRGWYQGEDSWGLHFLNFLQVFGKGVDGIKKKNQHKCATKVERGSVGPENYTFNYKWTQLHIPKSYWCNYNVIMRHYNWFWDMISLAPSFTL